MGDRAQIISAGILIVLIGMISAKVAEGGTDTLSCQITANCAGASVFRMSSAANAHAEIPSLSNYPNIVCCQSAYYSLGNSCETGVVILKLSGSTNAHVEKNTLSNYPLKACLSASGAVSCAYTTQDCAAAGYDACLATISSDTNAQVSDCVNNPYSTKICCRADCTGSIAGTVKDENNQPISGADVSAKRDLTTIGSATTNQQGVFNITSITCGTYNLAAYHPDYVVQTQTNISVSQKQQTTADFSLFLGTSCEQDCTFFEDIIVHASCHGKNGCAFYDRTAQSACDNSQIGWVRDYNLTHYVTCPSGAPQPKIEIQAAVSCANGNLVKITRIVVYNGKPVKLVVATCG